VALDICGSSPELHQVISFSIAGILRRLTMFTQKQDEVFSLKFGTEICEVILNLHMKHRTGLHHTGSLETGPCGAKARPASPNHGGRYALF
jgi:hypothetical protein